jgi:hypothetical protein
MKWIIPAVSAVALAAFASAFPMPFASSDAFASRMNGKPSCGQMNCMQDRYYASKRKAAKQNNPK